MAIHGKAGSVYLGANKVAEVVGWDLNLEAPAAETTNLDDAGWKSFIAGVKAWSGSLAANWKMTDTNGQLAIQAAILGGTTLNIEFRLDTVPHKYAGIVLPVTESIKLSVDAKVDVSFDFTGTADLQYTP